MPKFADMFIDPGRDPWREFVSLRWLLLHMIEEYARHNDQ
jgi:hypothetical protein